VLDYFQRRGGVRTFGYPVSNEFPLLGKRVQLFQRQALELHNDGSVGALNLLDPDFLPVTHFDGLNLPPPDPGLIASAPSPLDPDYLAQALAFIDQAVPDDWQGRQVNFHATFLGAVSCADAFGPDEACDTALLPAFGLEIWGLPTSRPMVDPNNDEFVYQRFQRGVMHYSASTGLTQGVLLGDWFKRVLLGSQVPADALKDLRGSRFLGQYAPNRPLGLARPSELLDTSLAAAFTSDTLVTAQVATETIPPGVVGTATSVAMTATAIGATQISLQTTQVAGTATALAALQTPTPITPVVAQTAAVPGAPAQPVVGAPTVSSDLQGTPTTIVGCLGDEQMWFTPRKPYIGTHVDISVTSQRRHDVHVMRLTGPIDPGVVSERSSIFGWTWTWTITPNVEGFYNWTFYADGLRPCITSGFPSLVQVGSTPTSTTTPVPSATATATNTITPTPTPGAPTIGSISTNTVACGGLLTINGSNFGSPPSSVTQVNLIGPATEGTHALTITAGSNTSILVQLPTTGLVAGPHTLTVSNQNGNGFATTGITVSAPC
jgi:hypothetical protein